MSWKANQHHGDVRGRWKIIFYFINRRPNGKAFWSREKEHPTWPEQKGLDTLKQMTREWLGKYDYAVIYDCQYNKFGHQILYYDNDGIVTYKQAATQK